MDKKPYKNKLNSFEFHSKEEGAANVTEEDVITCYKFYAPFYDWLFGKIFQPGREAIIEEVSFIRPRNVLEIGVGTGLTLPLYPSNFSVTAVDISSEMLKKAEEKAFRKNIRLMKINGEDLPFDNDSFSCVVLPYIYSVTPEPDKLITEVRRVCEKDGFIVIVNHFSGLNKKLSLIEKIFSPFAKKIGFSSEFSYEKYIEALGLEVLKSYSVNLFDLSRVVVLRNM